MKYSIIEQAKALVEMGAREVDVGTVIQLLELLERPAPEKPVALIDMDGTVADFDTAMRVELAKLAAPSETQAEYPDEETPPWIKARERLIKNQPGFWRNLARIDVGFRILQELKDSGFELHVLTKGPKYAFSAFTEKREWCEEHLNGIKVTISDDKSLVYGRILFDDWIPYVKSWLAVRPRGLVIMVDHPHNQGFDHPQVIRVYRDQTDFRELRARIEAVKQ
jgi:5'(3')-deoxyribonucleotidase